SQVSVKVPATSANLGPGFDTLGMALSHYDEYAVETIDNGLEIVVNGEGSGETPTDESNLIYKAFKLVFERLNRPVPAIRLTCNNSIPHGRGMGSSGAAVAGGVMLAAGLLAEEIELTEQQLLEFATEL
ncbi:MAG: homoserine kinase, partial [Aquiluna sp.]